MAIKIRIVNKGYSLIELLVVMVIFTGLGIIVTQSLATTLKGSKKSETTGRLRENIDNALSVMEREIRNAKSIESCESNSLVYTDQQDEEESFTCFASGGINSIRSSTLGGDLTGRSVGTAVNITSCPGDLFACSTPVGSEPQSVSIKISAVEASTGGAEGASYEVSTKILTRIY